MIKFFSLLRRPFRTQYRLTVLYKGDTKLHNAYALDRKLVDRMASHLAPYHYWTLYKRGPLGLPERIVDCSSWHEQKGGNQ